MDTGKDYQDKWIKLPFVGFGITPLEQERRTDWEKFASQILALQKSGNVGLIAETGAGKTVIAILTIIASDYRTLFLVPQRLLAEQHLELLNRISGNTVKARAITGLTKKRIWHDHSDRIIFATPHIFFNDMRRGQADINQFGFLILDELHKTVGDYPYVPIAKLAQKQGLKILALSASPGGDLAHLTAVKKNCFLSHWLAAKIKTPASQEKLEVVKPNKLLLEVESLFLALLNDAALDLAACGFELKQNNVLSFKESEHLRQSIQSVKGVPEYYEAISAYARYMKLRHAFQLAMSESYGTFLAFVQKLQRDKTKAASQILRDPDFNKIVSLANLAGDTHPKVARLLGAVYYLATNHRNALIFVAYKNTARHLLEVLRAEGMRVEMVFGGEDKNIKHQQLVLAKLGQRQLDFVLATSVVEEGISIPEVDAVIHYSMPWTEISRLQRSGRTGRLYAGEIIYIALDHFLDKALYWGTRSRLKRMRALIQEQADAGSRPARLRRYRGKIDLTLPLFS